MKSKEKLFKLIQTDTQALFSYALSMKYVYTTDVWVYYKQGVFVHLVKQKQTQPFFKLPV